MCGMSVIVRSYDGAWLGTFYEGATQNLAEASEQHVTIPVV